MTQQSHFVNSRFLSDAIFNGSSYRPSIMRTTHSVYRGVCYAGGNDNKPGHFEAATSTTTTSYCVTVTATWRVPRRRPAGMKGTWEYAVQIYRRADNGWSFSLGGSLRSNEIKHRNNGQLVFQEGCSLGLQLLRSDVISAAELLSTFRTTALSLSSRVEPKQKTVWSLYLQAVWSFLQSAASHSTTSHNSSSRARLRMAAHN